TSSAVFPDCWPSRIGPGTLLLRPAIPPVGHTVILLRMPETASGCRDLGFFLGTRIPNPGTQYWPIIGRSLKMALHGCPQAVTTKPSACQQTVDHPGNVSMQNVFISDIETIAPVASDSLQEFPLRFAIDTPTRHDAFDAFGFELRGWVCSSSIPVKYVD